MDIQYPCYTLQHRLPIGCNVMILDELHVMMAFLVRGNMCKQHEISRWMLCYP